MRGTLGIGVDIRLTNDQSSTLDPDTVAFKERVEADGGTVEDVNFLNSFITNAKNNNYYDDIVAAYSPSWGVKGTTTASDFYSVNGATTDIQQTTASKQPAVVSSAVNGKTVLRFDGTDDNFSPKAFAHNQPSTIIMAGFNQITWADSDRFYDGFSNLNMQAFQNAASPRMAVYAGSTFSPTDAGINPVLGSYNTYRALYNGASSVVAVNEVVSATGNAGANNGDGLTLGTNGGEFLPANFDLGSFVILNSAVDGSYSAKMLAIRDFFASTYNTPTS